MSGLEFALNIDGLTASSVINDADTVAIYDDSEGGIRKISRANFLSGITGALVYQGTWDASANSPTLADDTGTQGQYYVINVSGSQDLGSGSITFTVGDWAVHNGTTWEKLDYTSEVNSVFGRTGDITASSGDYESSEIDHIAGGNIVAANVQDAIDELDSEKLAKTLNSGLVFVGNASNVATGVSISGDITIDNTGAVTIGANKVELAADTTGNYIATLADSGESVFTIANSGSEDAGVTIALADDILDFTKFADALTLDSATSITLGGNDFTLAINGAGIPKITRTSAGEWLNLNDGTDSFSVYNSNGTPESSIAADIGSLAIDTSNGSLYIKTTDSLNTGWSQLSAATTGLLSLNGLTGQTQTFATGTTGTDFGIVSDGTVHTFNIPDASATARGLITTGTQTIAGAKTFSSNLALSGSSANLILGSNYLSGDGGDEGVFVDSDGEVGIGTNAPSAPLNIHAGSGTPGATQGMLRFETNTGTEDRAAKIGAVSGSSGYVYFQGIRPGVGNDANLSLNPIGGNVGIRNTAPTMTLDITGTLGVSGAITAPTSGDTINGLVINSGGLSGLTGLTMTSGNLDMANGLITNIGNAGTDFDSSGGLTLVSNLTMSGSSANLILGSNYLSGDGDDEGIYVDSSGNIGIGTTGPWGILHVVGGSQKILFSSTANSYGQLQLGNPSGKETSMAYIANMTAFGSQPTSSSGTSFVWNQGVGLYSALGSQYSIANQAYGGPIFLADSNGGISIGAYAKAINTHPVEGMIINGNVGIGTASPGSYKLYVAGNAWTTGTWGSSDERWKKNITELDGSLGKIMQLEGVSFNWKQDDYPDMGFDDGLQIGLIAQDVEKILPELVKTNDDGYKAVAYEKLGAVLIGAIQEQQGLIVESQNNIDGLISNNQNSTASLTDLATRLENIETTLASSNNEYDSLHVLNLTKLNTLEVAGAVTFKAEVNFFGKATFNKIAEFIDEVIFRKNVTFDEVITINKGSEIKDRATGDIYCSYIENGENKTWKGKCADLPEFEPEQASESTPTPTPEPTITPEITPAISPTPSPAAEQIDNSETTSTSSASVNENN